MKTEHYFTDIDDPEIIKKAFIEDRLAWDTGVESFQELEEFTTAYTSVHRLLLKSVSVVSQREFIDKKLFFTRKEAMDQGVKNGDMDASDMEKAK